MKYVDLFAGCGGLSLGFERAGFKLVLAVEKSEMAAHTFYHNFIKRTYNDDAWRRYNSRAIMSQYRSKLISKELKTLLGQTSLINDLRNRAVDVVMGGPPCQGFSLAGKRNPKDSRNQLPWQYLEFIKAVRPKAVIVENVVGMGHSYKQGRVSPFDSLREALQTVTPAYLLQAVHVNAMHYGVPEFRPRLMILGLRKDIAKAQNIRASGALWHSDFIDEVNSVPDMAPVPTTKKAGVRTLRDAIADLENTPTVAPQQGNSEFLEDMRDIKRWRLNPINSREIPNQNKRNHQERVKTRFRLYQYLVNQGLPTNILNIPAEYSIREARQKLKELLRVANIPAVSPDGTLLASTREELVDLVIHLKTKKHSQRPLKWDEPAPTVVTIPDDHIHPTEPRVFTVRELARLQSFPDAFEFRSKETTGSSRRRFEVPQYSQVGNAVPPLLAYSIGKRFREILNT